MSHWEQIEAIARGGNPVAVVFLNGTWTVSIGGLVRSDERTSAVEAIGEAMVCQAEAGLAAIAEAERLKRKLTLLNVALKEAA